MKKCKDMRYSMNMMPDLGFFHLIVDKKGQMCIYGSIGIGSRCSIAE
jgi:hypothetical protein